MAPNQCLEAQADLENGGQEIRNPPWARALKSCTWGFHFRTDWARTRVCRWVRPGRSMLIRACLRFTCTFFSVLSHRSSERVHWGSFYSPPLQLFLSPHSHFVTNRLNERRYGALTINPIRNLHVMWLSARFYSSSRPLGRVPGGLYCGP